MVSSYILFLSLCGLCTCAVVPLQSSSKRPAVEQNIWKSTTTPAQVARYLIHNSTWVSVGSLSAKNSTLPGYPNVGLKSISDGPDDNSTGILYFYMAPIESTALDLVEDNRVTVMASLAQSTLCNENNYNPQEPACARVFITGRLVKLEKSSPEYEFAKRALFSKHTSMSKWPEFHRFFVSKVIPSHIEVLSNFGGRQTVKLEDYLSADISNVLVNSSVAQKA